MAQVIGFSVFDFPKNSTFSSPARFRASKSGQSLVLHVYPADQAEDDVILCPGVLESEVDQDTTSSEMVFIEKLEENVVYRSRSCSLVYDGISSNCSECRKLSRIKHVTLKEESESCYGKEEDNYSYNQDVNEADESQTTVINFLKIKEHVEKKPSLKRKRKRDRKVEIPEKCPFCEKIYSEKTVINLSEHVKYNHIDERDNPIYKKICEERDTTAVCPYCAGVFLQVGLVNHIYKCHPEVDSSEEVFTCDIDNCGASFNAKTKLYRHKAKHNTKDTLCVTCGKVFPNQLGLQNHRNAYHGAPTICKECGQDCKSRSYLKTHIKLFHFKILDIACSECDFKTHDKQKLKKHVRIVHLKLKPYRCENCEYKASSLSNLNLHRKNIHKLEKLSALQFKELNQL